MTCLRIEIKRSIRYHNRWLGSGSAWQAQAMPMPWPTCAIDSVLKRNQPQKPGRGFYADVHRGWESVFAPGLLRGAVGSWTMENSYSATFACSCLRKFPILLTNRSFMPTSRTFMSSRKCGAMDLERDCWRKRYHGAAPGGPIRSFYGRLPEADLFIAVAVWLSLQIFSSCDALRVCRARPTRQNRSRAQFWQVESRLWKRAANKLV